MFKTVAWRNNVITMKSTTVCNVKVKYIRPQYRNLEEWMNVAGNEYIGRAGVVFVNGVRFPKHSSVWANPFKVGRDGSREKVVKAYDRYIRQKIREEHLENALESLRHKNLGCWCVEGVCYACGELDDMVCHGQVLMRILDEMS